MLTGYPPVLSSVPIGGSCFPKKQKDQTWRTDLELERGGTSQFRDGDEDMKIRPRAKENITKGSEGFRVSAHRAGVHECHGYVWVPLDIPPHRRRIMLSSKQRQRDPFFLQKQTKRKGGASSSFL